MVNFDQKMPFLEFFCPGAHDLKLVLRYGTMIADYKFYDAHLVRRGTTHLRIRINDYNKKI